MDFLKKNKKKAGILAFTVLVAAALLFRIGGFSRRENRGGGRDASPEQTTERNEAEQQEEAKPAGNGITICLDAGHGGQDPGKVGINDALEKDINLSLTLQLEQLLKEQGYTVVMTRTDDNGLYTESDSNKKMADLKKRISLIKESNARITVSIHQNSFTQQSSKGAQVFYYKDSAEGKRLAETLQEQIKTEMADGNRRVAKANDNYYMLLHTDCPMVIVECGFLSNPGEAALLLDEAYQQKMAVSILHGIEKYLEKDSPAATPQKEQEGS